MKYKLGDRVIARFFIEKTQDYKAGVRRYIKRKFWKSDAGHYKTVEEMEVMIVGKRTLSEGKIIFLGYDEGRGYKPERHFSAWLVVQAMNRRPVFVLDRDIIVDG